MTKSKEEQETEEIEEESDLEEDLEEAEEEIEEDKFVEFMAPSGESLSTSLGQVAVASELRATDLEQDLSNVAGLETKKEEDDPFKYKIGADPEEGPKYINSGNEIERTTSPSHVDVMNLGKESNMIPKGVNFSVSPETTIGEVGGHATYELPNKFDIEKAGKENVFKKEEIKYRPTENH